MDQSITTLRFTEQQLKDFAKYQKLRASNRYNMLDPRAVAASGLASDDYFFVIENYEGLAAQADAA